MLYNSNMACLLLGCLLKQSSLILQSNYPLSKNDFAPNKFHQVIFLCIQNLVSMGCTEITPIEIDNVLQAHPAGNEIALDNDYMSFIETTKSLASVENYEGYYNAVRKFTLLRDLKGQGFDITEFYDELGNEPEENNKLQQISIQQILNKLELKQAKIRGQFDVQYIRDEICGGENTQELIDFFKRQPSMGAMFQSGYLSRIWNGWSRGHLILRAGAAATGKSRLSVADLCQVGMKEMWDSKEQDFVPNANYQSPTLHIATEQDIRTEVEPMFLASVAEVEYRSIKNGLLTHEEELRVLKAGEIIKESGLTICSMPNFTTQSIHRKLKEQVELNGVKYVAFDYMEIQQDLTAEFKKNNAVIPRQDLILLDLTSQLKQYCEELNIGMITGCQLSSGWQQATFIDESFLAGSKAMKNKIDNGSIIVPTTYLKREMKLIEPFIKRKGFGENQDKLPNICETIFKGRYSIYGDRRLKLWTYFDRGTFRRHDYLLTDDNQEPQTDIKPIQVANF